MLIDRSFHIIEVVDVFTKLYPNIESLQLNNKGSYQGMLKARECLSAIHFRNLTSLQLYGSFQLHDGAFLIPVIFFSFLHQKYRNSFNVFYNIIVD